MAPGDSGLTSKVAKAGAPVSPAVISSPRPLDFLLRVCCLSIPFGPERAVGFSLAVVASSGKASVPAAHILLEKYACVPESSRNLALIKKR